ncbi:MAG: DUF4231 domain-containing protein [Alphaproteobacteria bacterium]|nr:DUF4231 domain-containing protein [Alphaproteobacteria bacterium]MBV9153543.1 DUF4231 domain-containing protein [Alphaproteobacteria bacterium]MBV9587216.1 DUF4231 domain-containing protein [Alphaproteobacteria bacterium]
MNADEFISERVVTYQQWYDRKAVIAKSRFLWMRGFSVVGGAIVPVLVNLPIKQEVVSGLSAVTIAVTIISLLVVICVSLESVLHYREQWKNYRSTEQLLGHEMIAFRAETGPYAVKGPEDRLRIFVQRVEDAIRAENTATLNVMTMAADAADAARGRSQIG